LALARVELLAGWSIELEGDYSREVEPDGAVVVWSEQETIRAMTVSVGSGPTGEPMSAREMLGEDLGEPQELPDGTLVVVGDEFEEDIEGAPAWSLPVTAARSNELLSLYFQSRSPGQFAWVPAAVKTLRQNGGDPPPNRD
jgi:hypothetical protein